MAEPRSNAGREARCAIWDIARGLAQAIYREGAKNVTAGANPTAIKRGILAAVDPSADSAVLRTPVLK